MCPPLFFVAAIFAALGVSTWKTASRVDAVVMLLIAVLFLIAAFILPPP